jgi:hypothetical protein
MGLGGYLATRTDAESGVRRKGTFTGKRPFRDSGQTAVVGRLAAAAAFAIAKPIA